MTLRELISSLNLPYFSLFLFKSDHTYNFTNLKSSYDVYANTIDVLMFKNGKTFFLNNQDENIDFIDKLEVLKYAKVLENDADNTFKVLLKN